MERTKGRERSQRKRETFINYKKGLKLIYSLRPGGLHAFSLWIHMVSTYKMFLSQSPPLMSMGIWHSGTNWIISTLLLCCSAKWFPIVEKYN